MSLNKDGNKIISLYIGKKKVVLKFADSSKLDVPFDVYTSSYLYEGKELSNDELALLKRMIKEDKNYQYAKKLVSSNLYSEKQIRDKLNKKEVNQKEIDDIINKLKAMHLIDDDKYLELALDSYFKKGYGRNRIVLLLLKRGIKEEAIYSKLPSLDEEINRANKLLIKLEKKYSNVNFSIKKKKIYNSLLRNGYDHQVALKVLDNIKSVNYEDELNLLRKDYKKYFEKCFKKYDSLNEIKNKTINYLLGKGYQFKDIKIIEEEFENESRMD